MKAFALVKESDGYSYKRETLGIYQEFNDAQREWLRLEAIRAPIAARLEANDFQDIKDEDEDEDAHITTYSIQPVDIITARKAHQMRGDQ